MNPTDLERLRFRLTDKRHPLNVRTPATINPDDRDKWRGFALSYAHLGRNVETFMDEAVRLGARPSRADYTLTRTNLEREIAAFRAELGDIFPAPASQPLPMVRFAQAVAASVRGGL